MERSTDRWYRSWQAIERQPETRRGDEGGLATPRSSTETLVPEDCVLDRPLHTPSPSVSVGESPPRSIPVLCRRTVVMRPPRIGPERRPPPNPTPTTTRPSVFSRLGAYSRAPVISRRRTPVTRPEYTPSGPMTKTVSLPESLFVSPSGTSCKDSTPMPDNSEYFPQEEKEEELRRRRLPKKTFTPPVGRFCPVPHNHNHGFFPTVVHDFKFWGKKGVCWNCGQKAHKFNQCRQRIRKPFCKVCGAPGYTVATCPQCRQHRLVVFDWMKPNTPDSSAAQQ